MSLLIVVSWEVVGVYSAEAKSPSCMLMGVVSLWGEPSFPVRLAREVDQWLRHVI